MTRKFGAEVVEKLIPTTDEVMLRRLRNVRKMDNRRKRMKEGQRYGSYLQDKGVSLFG